MEKTELRYQAYLQILKEELIPAMGCTEPIAVALTAARAAEALGRVCAMPTVSCPPAIPIVVSGERVGPAAIELFTRYHVETVAVIRE